MICDVTFYAPRLLKTCKFIFCALEKEKAFPLTPSILILEIVLKIHLRLSRQLHSNSRVHLIRQKSRDFYPSINILELEVLAALANAGYWFFAEFEYFNWKSNLSYFSSCRLKLSSYCIPRISRNENFYWQRGCNCNWNLLESLISNA